MKERVDEVDAKKGGDYEAENRFVHVEYPSEIGAECRVSDERHEQDHGTCEKDHIEHLGAPQPWFRSGMSVRVA
jgi:hypothetical protein